MRIGIDVDGVLAEFLTPYMARIVSVTGRDLFGARPVVWTSWHHETACGYTSAELHKVWQSIEADPLFWRCLSPCPETATFLVRIAALVRNFDVDVYFITARVGSSAKSQTERWLSPFLFNDYGSHIFPATVLIASDKAAVCKALDLDAYIDDRWENALAVAEGCRTQAYLLDRPWNQVAKDADGEEGHGYVRLKSLKDFLACAFPSYERAI